MEEGKRFIVIADAETGKVIKEGPVGDEIWPPVWSADGKGSITGRSITGTMEEGKLWPEIPVFLRFALVYTCNGGIKGGGSFEKNL